MWPLWNDYGGAVANIRGQSEWAGALLSPGSTATSTHHSWPKKGSAHTLPSTAPAPNQHVHRAQKTARTPVLRLSGMDRHQQPDSWGFPNQ